MQVRLKVRLNSVAQLSNTPLCRAAPRAHGFTLVELLVVVAISAILMAIALPDFVRTTRGIQLQHQAKEMAAAISLTRSEALRRGQTVVMCRSNAAQSACNSAGSPAWQDGWIIFVDADNSGGLNAGETIVAIKGSMASGISVSTSNLARIGYSIAFNAAGELIGTAANGHLTFDYAGSPTSIQSHLILNRTGRVQVLSDEQCLANAAICP